MEWHGCDPPLEGKSLAIIRVRSVLLDSSVVIKWFRKSEIWREEAVLLRREYLEGRLMIYVPDLLILEIANVLRYKKDLSRQQVLAAIKSLYGLKIEILNLSRAVINKAIELAYSRDLTLYDASFVAAAHHLNVPFVTADEKLIQKLGDLSGVYHIKNFSLECVEGLGRLS